MILYKLMKQDFKNLFNTSVIIAACTYFPWGLIFLFGFTFSSVYGGDGITSYDYYGVSLIIFMTFLASTITPNTFFEEKLKAGNTRIAFSPVSRVSVYMSKILSTFIFMAISFAISIIGLNFLNIVNFGGNNLGYVIILLDTFLIFAVSLGGAACVIVKTEELTNNILFAIIMVLSIFSGVFFPLESLGKWFVKISEYCPLKWIVDVTFNIIYDGNFQNYGKVIMGLIILSIICLVVVHFCYKQEDYI